MTIEHEATLDDARAVQATSRRAVAPRASSTAVATPDPLDLFKIALSKGASVEALRELNALQERVAAFRARQAFEMAVAAARADLPVIVKNRNVKFDSKRTGGTTDYAHEDLAQIATQIDPVLSKHGLSYRFKSRQTDARVTIMCILSHRDGHVEEAAELSAPNDLSGNKNPAQAVASSSTLLSRYTLKLSLGLSAAEVDDDGQSAYAEPSAPQQTQQQAARPPRASQSQASQQQAGPRALTKAHKDETPAQWAQRYIAGFKTADTDADMVQWDHLNSATLENIFQRHKPVYEEIEAAFDKHRNMLATKEARKRDGNITSGPQTIVATPPIWDHPDPEKEYEPFLVWAESKLSGWTPETGDLEAFWNTVIEGAKPFPPDRDNLMSLYRKAEHRLEAAAP